MNYRLGQIAREFEFGDVFVGFTEIVTEVEPLKLCFLRKDSLDLLGEAFVSGLFIVEKFGSFGGIVNYLCDLGFSVQKASPHPDHGIPLFDPHYLGLIWSMKALKDCI